MAEPLRASEVRFVRATEESRAAGLEGWVSFTLGRLRLDRVAVRRTRGGKYVLSFPAHRASRRRSHSCVRPLDDIARREIERQVFRSLGLAQEAAP